MKNIDAWLDHMKAQTFVPNAMCNAFTKAAMGNWTNRLNPTDQYITSTLNGNGGYQHEHKGKGWNASLSMNTYKKIKEQCGL